MKQIIVSCLLLAIISSVQSMDELNKKQWRNSAKNFTILIRSEIEEMNSTTNPLCRSVKEHIVFVLEKEVLFSFNECDKPESTYPIDDCYFAYDKYFRQKIRDIKESNSCEENICQFWDYEVTQGPRRSTECFHFHSVETLFEIKSRCGVMEPVITQSKLVDSTMKNDCTTKEIEKIIHAVDVAWEDYHHCQTGILTEMKDNGLKLDGGCLPWGKLADGYTRIVNCCNVPLKYFKKTVSDSQQKIEECSK